MSNPICTQVAPVELVKSPSLGQTETISSMMIPGSWSGLGNYIENMSKAQRSKRAKRARAARWDAKRRGSLEFELVYYDVVFYRDGGICGICGRSVEYELGTMDHIKPCALGGPHTYNNIQLAHGECNRKKGRKHESSILDR